MCKVNWEERMFHIASGLFINGNSITDSIDMAKMFKERFEIEFGEDDEPKERKKKDKGFNPYEDLSYVEDKYKFLWKEWLDYKKSIKSQYKTQKGAVTQYNSWVRFSEGSINLANAIIKRSIENSWSGLFELKDKEKALYGSPRTPYGFIVEKEDLGKKEDGKLVIGGVTYR